MEDRRTALAIVISMIIVLMYSQSLTTPQITQTTTNNSVQTVADTNLNGVSQSQHTLNNQELDSQPSNLNSPAILSATREQVDSAGFISVVTNLYNSDFTRLGGRLRNLRLTQYSKDLGSDELVNLVEEEPTAQFPLGLSSASANDSGVLYSVSAIDGLDESGLNTGQSYRLSGEKGSITLLGEHPAWGTITKKFIFSRSGYLIDIEVSTTNATPAPLALEWNHALPTDKASTQKDPWQISLLASNGELERLAPEKVTAPFESKGLLKWASLGDRYFQAALLASEGTTSLGIGHTGNTVSLKALASNNGGAYKIYLGPKDQEILINTGFELRRTIDLGFFTIFADPLLQLLRFFNTLLGNYGLAIILLTLVLKIAFFPLTSISFKSMQKMQEIQPEVDKLRAKYKDASELNQAMMELYKKKGVNPLGGCLPIFIQIPVFFGLYNSLLQSIEIRHQPFALWVTDLSSPEKLILFGIPIPLMIIIMGGTMIWQQWTTPTSGDPTQKKIMMFMPVMFTLMFILFPMPAGLVLYWLVNNIMSITQQLYQKNAHGTHPFVATMITSVVLFVLGYLAVLTTA